VKTTMAMTLVYAGTILFGISLVFAFLCVNVIGLTMEQDLWTIGINNSYFVQLSIILHFVFLWEVDVFFVLIYVVITLMGKMS
jgi:hypothetical protein